MYFPVPEDFAMLDRFLRFDAVVWETESAAKVANAVKEAILKALDVASAFRSTCSRAISRGGGVSSSRQRMQPIEEGPDLELGEQSMLSQRLKEKSDEKSTGCVPGLSFHTRRPWRGLVTATNSSLGFRISSVHPSTSASGFSR